VGVIESVLASTVPAASGAGVAPQNVNFAIKTTAVREFLDANHLRYATVSGARIGSAAAVTQEGKKFTVLVECWR